MFLMIIQFLLIFTFIDVVHVVFDCLEQIKVISSLFRKRAKSAAEVIAGYVYSRFVTKFPLLCCMATLPRSVHARCYAPHNDIRILLMAVCRSR